MLLRFRVSNFRSFRDPQELSLIASDHAAGVASIPLPARGNGEPPAAKAAGGRVAQRSTESVDSGDREWVLPAAGIYGPNGSGKSNIVKAFLAMRLAVRDSHRWWEPDHSIPFDPFRLGRDTNHQPTEFSIDFVVESVRYTYGFTQNSRRIQEESLYAFPKGRRRMLFERDEDGFDFGRMMLGEKRVLETITRPNSLFLSAGAQNNHPQLQPLYRWFVRHLRYAVPTGLEDRISFTSSLFAKENPITSRIQELLRFADLGIVRVRLQEKGEGKPENRLRFEHQGAAGTTEFPLSAESDGTRQWFGLLGPLVEVLTTGGCLVADELDASLHPNLTVALLGLFQDPTINTKGAQLVFTTHDTGLLHPLQKGHLRRDQIWLADKSADGASSLIPITDFKPRGDANLERQYLSGRFGALPLLDRTLLEYLRREISPHQMRQIESAIDNAANASLVGADS